MKKIPPKYVVNLWMKMSSYQLPLSHSLSTRPDSVCSTTLIQFLLYFPSVIFLFYFNFFPSICHPIPCFPWHAIAMLLLLLLPLLMVRWCSISLCVFMNFFPSHNNINSVLLFYYKINRRIFFPSFCCSFRCPDPHSVCLSAPNPFSSTKSSAYIFSSPIRHEHSFVVKHFYMLHSIPQPLLVHIIR